MSCWRSTVGGVAEGGRGRLQAPVAQSRRLRNGETSLVGRRRTVPSQGGATRRLSFVLEGVAQAERSLAKRDAVCSTFTPLLHELAAAIRCLVTVAGGVRRRHIGPAAVAVEMSLSLLASLLWNHSQSLCLPCPPPTDLQPTRARLTTPCWHCSQPHRPQNDCPCPVIAPARAFRRRI